MKISHPMTNVMDVNFMFVVVDNVDFVSTYIFIYWC